MSTAKASRIVLKRLGASSAALLSLHLALPTLPWWVDGVDADGRAVLLVGAHALRQYAEGETPVQAYWPRSASATSLTASSPSTSRRARRRRWPRSCRVPQTHGRSTHQKCFDSANSIKGRRLPLRASAQVQESYVRG
jgi:hypothetical protein